MPKYKANEMIWTNKNGLQTTNKIIEGNCLVIDPDDDDDIWCLGTLVPNPHGHPAMKMAMINKDTLK